MPVDYNETYGNEQAKPRSETRSNPIVDNLSTHLNFTELSYADSSYWADSQVKPYNPDDLVQKRFDYSIYEEMTKDDQVSVCLQIKRDLILASGFDITVDSTDEGVAKIAKEIEQSLYEDPQIPLIDALEEVQSAFEYGFSLGEKIFNIKENGMAFLKCIKVRHPVTWLLHTDVHGNIQRYEQRGPEGSIDINPDSLVHYKVNQRFQNPYGKSDLRAAWEAWFIKKEIIKFYAIFLEKAASPTPVARYDKNIPQQAVDDIFAAIKKLQTKTALALPKDIELEFLETSNQGEVYVKGINLFNMFIGRSLLVPDLLGFQGSETSGGSYSLGKEQMNVFFRHINRRRSSIEDLVNREIVKPLVYHNYGKLDPCPKFKLRPMSDEDAKELAKLWIEVVKGKVYIPNDEEINHFRHLAKFPEGEVEREELQPLPSLDGEMELPKEGDPKQEDSREQDTDKEEQEPKSPKEDASFTKEYKRFYDDTIGSYSKKVNFKLIENTMDTLLASTLTQSQPIVAKVFDDLFKQVKKKKIIEKQDISLYDSVKPKYTASLKTMFKRVFLSAHKESINQARNELLKGNFATPLPAEEFLKFLEDETFAYVGDWEYQISKSLRQALIAAIKDGKPLSQVIAEMEGGLSDLSDVSIERYARTKFTEVMNKGRMEFFEESGVIAAYQYSAIMDDRTTEICSGLHGKIFEKGDEPVPPLHFNCRSLLIPITKYEDYKADKSAGGMNIDKFIEKNIGDGFAVK